MAIILPILSFLLANFYLYSKTQSFRFSLLLSAIGHALFVLFISEASGAIGILSRSTIVMTWLAALVGMTLLLRKRILKDALLFAEDLRTDLRSLQRTEWQLLSMLILLIAPLMVVASFGTPNNHDSMTYHLPRILMWFQNRSLHHFPSDDFRMLYNPPLAELMQAHAWVLSGGYEPAMNLVQLASYLILIVDASLIAKRLGATLRTQLVAAIVTASLPSLVLEAPTTQNDLVMGSLMFAGLAIMLEKDAAKFTRNWIVGLTALGLALAAKATALLFIPFLLIIPGVRLLRLKQFIGVPLVIIVLLPSAGWLARNQDFFGNPLGYHDRQSMEAKINFYSNRPLTPSRSISAAVRNLSVFLATPWKEVNKGTEAIAEKCSLAFGIETDDSGSSWYGQKYHVPVTGPHEDSPPVFWHFILTIILFCGILTRDIRNRKISPELSISMCCIAGMISTAAYVKWMPWNIRYMSLWLIPLLAANINQVWLTKRRVLMVLSVLFMLAAFPFSCCSLRRSLLSCNLTIESKELGFVSVFKRDKALKYTLDKQDARELQELRKVVADLGVDTILLVRHGIDPAIFPFMSLAADGLNQNVEFSFMTGKDAPGTTDIVVTLGKSNKRPEIDGCNEIFHNGYGTVWRPSSTSH